MFDLKPKEKLREIIEYDKQNKLDSIIEQNTTCMAQMMQAFNQMTNQMTVLIGKLAKDSDRDHKKVREIEKRLAVLEESQSKSVKRDMVETITDEQHKTLTSEINFRVFRVLGLPMDEADYCDADRATKIMCFGKFVSRLRIDAKNSGLMASKIENTSKENYTALLSFIRSWEPRGGVERLKDIAIKEYAEKKKLER
ncbi:MAG: hypothetical protein NC307_12270 [Roseburia sp.]|nr:hypothetical protein [Roseburia sp.]